MIGDVNMDYAVTQEDKRYAEFIYNLNKIARDKIKFKEILKNGRRMKTR